MEQFDLSRSAALIYENGEKTHGLSLAEVSSRAAASSVLFNISGHITHPEIKGPAQCSVYYDDDPGYTQFWHANGEAGAELIDHDHHFTIGANIGAVDCDIPTGGIRWRHTRPPVVLSEWPRVESKCFNGFTTVASWRGAYGPVSFGGRNYGLKVHEFRKFVDLPVRTAQSFEIALQIHPADRKDLATLQAHQWQIVDPRSAAHSPDAFRQYVQRSSAEFSVAQGIYVETSSGWFSDRTSRYLASGKPALVQETGLRRHYPVGNGLLTFRTLEEAIDGAERIAADYPMHCRVARRLAEEYFDADIVVRRLAADIGLQVVAGSPCRVDIKNVQIPDRAGQALPSVHYPLWPAHR
jgi:hypothetical protein